jgi:hypothetical protein
MLLNMRDAEGWGWRTRKAVGNAVAIYLALSDETAQLMDARVRDFAAAEQLFVSCRGALLMKETRRGLHGLRRVHRVLDHRLPGMTQRMDAFVIDHYSAGRRFSDLEWGPFIREFVPQSVR